MDRGLGRVSRFKLDATHSHFIDSFRAPGITRQTAAAFDIADSHSFWFHPRSADQRIHRINDSGIIMTTFGDLWIPERVLNRRGSAWIFNVNFLKVIGHDSLTVVWRARPRIELWNVKGELLIQKDIDVPEIIEMQSRKSIRRYGSDQIKRYCKGITVDALTHNIYSLIPYKDNIKIIYGFSADTLLPIQRFSCVFDKDISFRSLVIDIQSEFVRFFTLDLESGGVMVLEP